MRIICQKCTKETTPLKKSNTEWVKNCYNAILTKLRASQDHVLVLYLKGWAYHLQFEFIWCWILNYEPFTWPKTLESILKIYVLATHILSSNRNNSSEIFFADTRWRYLSLLKSIRTRFSQQYPADFFQTKSATQRDHLLSFLSCWPDDLICDL